MQGIAEASVGIGGEEMRGWQREASGNREGGRRHGRSRDISCAYFCCIHIVECACQSVCLESFIYLQMSSPTSRSQTPVFTHTHTYTRSYFSYSESTFRHTYLLSAPWYHILEYTRYEEGDLHSLRNDIWGWICVYIRMETHKKNTLERVMQLPKCWAPMFLQWSLHASCWK